MFPMELFIVAATSIGAGLVVYIVVRWMIRQFLKGAKFIGSKFNQKVIRPAIVKFDQKAMEDMAPLEAFEYGRSIGDMEGMKAALQRNYETCPSKNSYCLVEVFCPECPLGNGGLTVVSARHGM